jgi:two-component system OmpR family sensor kinase
VTTRAPARPRREHRLTLKARVIISFVATAIFLITINIFLASLLDGDINSNFNQSLYNTASTLLTQVNNPASASTTQQIGAISLYEVVAITTVTAKGPQTSVTGPQPDLQLFYQLEDKMRAGTTDSGGWRFYKVSDGKGKASVVVGSSLSTVTATTSRIAIEIAILSITSLVILGILSIWVISIGIKPLATLSDVAKSITAGARGKRVDLDQHLQDTEFGDVATAFNEVLGSLEGHIVKEQGTSAEMRQFVADAGHELRTPLTSISGYTQLLKSGTLSEEASAEALERVTTEALRMNRIIDSLLSLARMETRTDMHFEYLDAVALTKDQVLDHQALDGTRPVTILGDHEAHLEADYDQFTSIIANLLANLRTHTPEGTSATITITSDEETLHLVYQDNGPGVTDPSSLFKRFWRAPGTKAPGSGLGMAIVYGAVRAHHGTISATSTPGHGLCLDICLPLQVPELPGDTPTINTGPTQ